MAKTSDTSSASASNQASTRSSERGSSSKKKGRRKAASKEDSSKGSGEQGQDGRAGRSSKSLDVDNVFQRELREIRDGEQQLGEFLPKLEEKSRTRELQECLERLHSASERFQRSLGRVAEEHGGDETGRCNAMRGLISEARKGLRSVQTSPERDVLTIANVQKMLHYTIASYGSLRAWSSLVGDEDARILFDKLVDERKRLDRSLTEIAQESLYSGAGSR